LILLALVVPELTVWALAGAMFLTGVGAVGAASVMVSTTGRGLRA